MQQRTVLLVEALKGPDLLHGPQPRCMPVMMVAWKQLMLLLQRLWLLQLQLLLQRTSIAAAVAEVKKGLVGCDDGGLSLDWRWQWYSGK
jgi:hypothetical protein